MSKLPQLYNDPTKRWYRQSGIIPANSLNNALSRSVVRPGRNIDCVQMPDGSIRVDGAAGFPWDKVPFGHEFTGGNTIDMKAGRFVVHGVGEYTAAAQTVALSGATAYVYATLNKSSKAAAIAATSTATRPSVANASEYRIVLRKLESTDGGTTYSITEYTWHGDYPLSGAF
jgi:hypothetical protein